MDEHEKVKDAHEGMESRTFYLDKENVQWLERMNEKSGRKSVSNTLDFLLTNLRTRKNIGMHYGD